MASRHDIVLNIRAEIKDTKAKLKQLQTNLRQTGGATKQLADVTGSASFAVVSLGQGFADAGQFSMGMAQGVRAVTNNVQQAATAFAMLHEQTGSMKGAFKAFGTAMKGPVGLLLAFSAVTAAIEFFSNRSQQAKSKTDGLKEAILELVDVVGDPQRGMAVRFETVAEQVENARAGLEAISTILAGRGQVMNLSLLFKSIFGGETGGSVSKERLEELLLLEISLKNIVNLYGDMVDEQRDLDNASDDAVDRFSRQQFLAGLAAEEIKKLSESNMGLADSLAVLLGPEGLHIANLVKEEQHRKRMIAHVERENRLALTRQAILRTAADETEKAAMAAALIANVPQIIPQYGTSVRDFANEQRDKLSLGLPATDSGFFQDRDVNGQLLGTSVVTDQTTASVSALDKAMHRLSRTMSSALSGAITGLAGQLPELLAGTTSIADVAATTIGSLAQQIGAAMIAFGTAGVVIKTFTTNPVAAILAGTALVALGAALKSSVDSSVGAATGGRSDRFRGVSSGGPSSFGSNPRSVVASSMSSLAIAPGGGFVQHQFVVRGNDLVTVADGARASNVRVIGR